MKLSELQEKRVVSISDGSYIGEIIDVNITLDGNIESLVVEKSKFLISKFSSVCDFIDKFHIILSGLKGTNIRLLQK